MDIIKLAFNMTDVVQRYVDKARRFYYWIMLLGHRCSECGASLVMVAEGRCRCDGCQNELDPTVSFQSCSTCGGTPVLRVRRYQCRNCGSDIASKFLFDGRVFNADYFRQKMSESRQRKKRQTERVRKMLLECRSTEQSLPYIDFGTVPGLTEALNGLTSGIGEDMARELHNDFDLSLYQRHIQAHIQDFPVELHDVPSLSENVRKDLIWRFIAAIFLCHMGVIDIEQQQERIMVIRHEVDN